MNVRTASVSARRLLLLSLVVLAVAGLAFLVRGGRKTGSSADDALAPEVATRERVPAFPGERAPVIEPPRPVVDSAPAALPELASAAAHADAPVPPGFLEGLVLRGSEPVGGGTAWILDAPSHDESDCAHCGPELAREHTTIGSDGRFRFAVEPGRYCVGVDAAPLVRRIRAIEVRAGQGTSRWIVRLGTGEIRGHVWSADGDAAGDVSIRFAGGTFLPDGRWQQGASGSTRSGPDGAHRLLDLEAGSYGLEARLGTGRTDPARGRRRRRAVVLAPTGALHSRTRAQPGSDGRWHFLAVAEGEYEVWAETTVVARPPPDARLPLRVRSGEGEIALELVLDER